MNAPLLATKLFIPPPRPDLVYRSRLMEQMTAGLHGKLTLISAPAGYGKTTLLSAWISQVGRPVAWVSLDDDDNEIPRFFDYLIAALQTIAPKIGGMIPKLQGSSESPLISVVFTALINEITNLQHDILVVLDDYHVIKGEDVHHAMRFLLENLPINLHIIIASRADPPLRVARLRALSELCEIRAEDLRFTVDESIRFLNQRMMLGLSSSEVATLTKKTEGWIVGLQLAAISLQKHPDKGSFVTAFAGDDRYIVDYLLEEALNRQPCHVKTFLLQTSILDRLSVPLCNAVTNRQDSQEILVELGRANLFLVPLDNQRNWFRYHHLFADLLKNHLHQTKAGEVLNLHLKASIWYEENDLLPDAINHALAANKIERVVQLTEEMAVYKMDYGELNVLLAWLDRLPEDTYRQYPWLLVTRTWALFNIGKYEAVEANLSEIENIQFKGSESNELTPRIRGHVAAIRSNLAELREDILSAIQLAEDALGLLPEKDTNLRSFVAIRWANCLAWLGDFDKAIQSYKEAGEASKLVGDGQLAIIALSEMAVIQMITGKLRQAVESITDIINYAEMLAQRDGRRLTAMGILYRHMSSIMRQQNKLTEASYYAEEAVKICQQWGEKDALLFSLLALVRVQFAQGEYEKVDQNFNQILQIAGQVSSKVVTYFNNWVIHYQLAREKVNKAELWVRELGLTADDKFDYARRFVYQNYARLLYTKGYYSQALEIVENLLNVVADVDAKIFTINYKVLQAKILKELNKPEGAILAMEGALSLAHSEGYVSAILDEGEPVAYLLYQAAQEGEHAEYCLRLLDEFSVQTNSAVGFPRRNGDLVEPLSDREIEVIKHIADGLTNQEIAQELVLSLYTIKSHARNIYNKLGVKNRTEAVARARMLGLLSQD